MKFNKLFLGGLLVASLGVASIPIIFSNKQPEKRTDAVSNKIYTGINTSEQTIYLSTTLESEIEHCNAFFEAELISNGFSSPFYSLFAGYSISEVKYINFLTEIRLNDCSALFCDFTSLIDIINFNHLNTSNCEYMRFMFKNCTSLKTLDFSSLNTSNVTNFEGMFDGSGFTSLDLRSFNTRSAYKMREMFGNCQDLTSLDISSFDTTYVSDFSFMFSGLDSLDILDISNFDMCSNHTIQADYFIGTSHHFGLIKTPIGDGDDSHITIPFPIISGPVTYYDSDFRNEYPTILPLLSKSVTIVTEGVKDNVEYFTRSNNNKFDLQCKADGSSDPVEIGKIWSSAASTFNGYSPATKQIISTCGNSNANTEVVEFASRYDYIYKKYANYFSNNSIPGDFANRNPLELTPGTSLNVNRVINTSDFFLIVSVASMALILGVVGISFTSKKEKL